MRQARSHIGSRLAVASIEKTSRPRFPPSRTAGILSNFPRKLLTPELRERLMRSLFFIRKSPYRNCSNAIGEKDCNDDIPVIHSVSICFDWNSNGCNPKTIGENID
jgi:hypothetical protein